MAAGGLAAAAAAVWLAAAAAAVVCQLFVEGLFSSTRLLSRFLECCAMALSNPVEYISTLTT